MTELRLHLAEDEPKEPMPRDVTAALIEWRAINARPGMWATFELIQFNANTRVVRVTYGTILDGGFKEAAIATLHYSLTSEGELIISKSTHL